MTDHSALAEETSINLNTLMTLAYCKTHPLRKKIMHTPLYMHVNVDRDSRNFHTKHHCFQIMQILIMHIFTFLNTLEN